MLPSTPVATQLFHSLPACVEDLNMDALSTGDIQMDFVGDNIQQLFEEFLQTSAPAELLKLYPMQESEMQYSAASAGLVFGNGKMASSDADQRNINSPVIPLSVQQAQMDNIDPETIAQSDFIQDDVFGFVISDDGAPMTATTTATLPHFPADRLSQTSADTTDQTVPFRRHDSACSVLSSCSDIKTERRSFSAEVESIATSSPPPTSSQLPNHAGRRGRPCSNDVSVFLLPYRVQQKAQLLL